nr:glycosyltransferase family 1 protein [Virgibacillus sp. AGTR]
MINLLFIAKDTSKMINRNYFYLEQELKNVVHLTIWRKPGHIDYILRQLETRPDFILLLNDIDRHMSPKIKGLAHIDIPTGLFVNDVHRFISLRRNFINKNNIDYLFSVIRDKFLTLYPEFQDKMEWFPHFVNIDVCKDYKLKKDFNLLLMGAVSDTYPLRQKIIKTYEGNADFIYYRHPGYQSFRGKEQEKMIEQNYAKELNRSKLFFTCPSRHNYPVLKYFEALACKTLLLAPTFKELEDIGFIPGVHFVAIDENDFEEKAAYFLAHETERKQIIEQGYRFIHQHHTVQHRAQQLVKKIEKILQSQ